MLKYLIIITLAAFGNFAMAAGRPSLIITQSEAEEIRSVLGHYLLIDNAFNRLQKDVEKALVEEIELPMPGEAGGYAHEKHKQNYSDMKSAGILFAITKDEKYARFIKKMLDGYAKMYPTLPAHPLAHDQKPGKLFHQMLNEAVWLLNTAQAYDCVYDWLTAEDRSLYETNIFIPMAKWFTRDHPQEFNRIHNHGMWVAASVGMIGYVMNNRDYIEMALNGTEKDGNGGFLKQVEMLFSPDGYYMEGAYYVRYAMRPLFFFAEAIERNQPEVKIYEFKDQIIKKAYYAGVNCTFPNGIFVPINDASRTMDIKAPGVVYGNSIVYDNYGEDINLLGIAKVQGEVPLNKAGLKLARDFADKESVPDFTWKSLELTDGYDGKQGGLGILRTGEGQDQTMLLMKYGVHGLGHGHFDKLHFIFYDQQKEVIPDYGFARWINIEPKFGGRYLPENKSYAMQTIAHNTVVVDEQCQNNFNRKAADQVHGDRHFFDISDIHCQVMSARADNHYDGVEMQRTMFLIRDENLEWPVVVDLYRLKSQTEHQYDYPIHFRGQLMATNFEYASNSVIQNPMGEKAGYQHLWYEAVGKVKDCPSITWLHGHRYYSVIASNQNAEVLFGRTGANDPNFNLVSEPMFLIREKAKDHLFAAVIEPHGYFNEASESTRQARPRFQQVEVIGFNDDASVVRLVGDKGLDWIIIVNNREASGITHTVTFKGREYEWTGNYSVQKSYK
ncbi:MAG: alginate lyase family protein [Candidatus Marinimicrobia bacterium]|nr:alginate lyase family protein [Candidatus Neomarinimicrobiota bacterium]